MKKNITIVSAYFHPDITPRSFRTTELAKEFAKLGHKVTLYIPYRTFDYTQLINEYNFDIKFLAVNKLSLNLPNGNEIYKKIIRFCYYQIMKLTEYPFIKLYYKIPTSLTINNDTDLLISIAYPHTIHWGVEKALRKNNNSDLVWVADCGDPYMGDKTSHKPFYFKIIEKKFCKRANFITVPLEDAIQLYYPQFRNKIRIVPQGFDLSTKEQYQKTDINPVPTFAYAGIFYSGYRDPQIFFDFLSTIDIDFKMIIYSKNNSIIQKYKSILGNKLEINDFIPRNELLQKLSQMDFLINFENREKGQSPSKLIDYYIANRPILSVPHEKINTNTILEFISGKYEQQFILENIENYDIKNVAQKFLSLQ